MENNPVIKQSQPGPLQFLIFSASLRKDSLNTRLAKLATLVIEKNGGKTDYADMSEFDCPSFNQDLELNGAYPSGAKEFRKRLLAKQSHFRPDFDFIYFQSRNLFFCNSSAIGRTLFKGKLDNTLSYFSK